MTKAEQILQLYAQGLSTREIAEKVGCRPEYVRVVARQRKGTGRSEIDKRYDESALGRQTTNKRHAMRYATDPEYRAKHDANKQRWIAENRDRWLAYHREYYRRRKAEASA